MPYQNGPTAGRARTREGTALVARRQQFDSLSDDVGNGDLRSETDKKTAPLSGGALTVTKSQPTEAGGNTGGIKVDHAD